MLLRAVIDHVPPVFGVRTFAEVASNYEGGRSFRSMMRRLDEGLRKAADIHLHSAIRKKEVLPEFTQVNFRSELDFLLSEVIRIVE